MRRGIRWGCSEKPWRSTGEQICCPTSYDLGQLKTFIPEEVLKVSYGCGTPARLQTVRSGETVLDIKRKNAAVVAANLGYPVSNVEFRKGMADAMPVEAFLPKSSEAHPPRLRVRRRPRPAQECRRSLLFHSTMYWQILPAPVSTDTRSCLDLPADTAVDVFSLPASGDLLHLFHLGWSDAVEQTNVFEIPEFVGGRSARFHDSVHIKIYERTVQESQQ